MRTYRQLFFWALTLVICVVSASCNNGETYADQKEKETKAIETFLERNVVITTPDRAIFVEVGKINVITEEQFALQNYTTDLLSNQYVLIQKSGVYLQIREKGYGNPLKNGESARLACRFLEYNILGDSLQSCNWGSAYPEPDFIDVSNNYGSFTATFAVDAFFLPLMFRMYNSTSVPSGWLDPLAYVNVDNPTKDNVDVKRAEVRIIVPHGQGHSYASQLVCPFFYIITYERV